MKYIDAEKLIALLEQRKKQLAQWTDKEYANQRIDEIDCILDVDIDSLQQEQPEVDLEELNEEIKKEMVKLPFFTRGKDQIAFARHFAEWGAEHLKK